VNTATHRSARPPRRDETGNPSHLKRTAGAGGAFFEVSELSGGSVWLRATRAIEEFDESRSAAVATALAPVLVAAGVL